VTDYVRTGGGEVIHRADCRRVGAKPVPWLYAEGFTAFQIEREVLLHPWLHACLACSEETCLSGSGLRMTQPLPGLPKNWEVSDV